MSESAAMSGSVVLVPVKAFSKAKQRLGPQIPASIRSELARLMATVVVEAAAPLPVAVVCDDDEVANWARSRGCMVLMQPGRGLNGAVESGITELADLGADRVAVVHADLPKAHGISALIEGTGVTLVPDRRDDGTNVAIVPSRSGFRFSYGPGSFSRHCQEASRLGLQLLVVRTAELSWDVDLPDDIPGELLHDVTGLQ